MPDNYYSDDEATTESQAAAEGGDTALLPRSFLGGSTQPGDTITLRVSRIMDDQIEVMKESYKEEEAPEDLPVMPNGPMGGGMPPGPGMFE